MDNSFIPKAIDMVKDAIAADTNQEYEIALGLYKKSLEYFMTGLKYESNPVSTSEKLSFWLLLLFVFRACIFYDFIAKQRKGLTKGALKNQEHSPIHSCFLHYPLRVLYCSWYAIAAPPLLLTRTLDNGPPYPPRSGNNNDPNQIFPGVNAICCIPSFIIILTCSSRVFSGREPSC